MIRFHGVKILVGLASVRARCLRLPRALLGVTRLLVSKVHRWQPWCPRVRRAGAPIAADAASVSPAEARSVGEKMSVILVRAGAVVVGSVLLDERDRFVTARPKGGGHRAALVFLRIHKERVAGVERSEVVQITRFLCMFVSLTLVDQGLF